MWLLTAEASTSCFFLFGPWLVCWHAPAVRDFLVSLVQELRSIGMEVNLDKTEARAPTPNLSGHPTSPDVFERGQSFRLLGAAACACAWCKSLAKAKSPLNTIYRFPDVQGGLMSPPILFRIVEGALLAQDSGPVAPPFLCGLCGAGRSRGLGHVSGSRPSDDDWRIAASRRRRVMGYRRALPGANVPSFSACIDLR